MIGTSIVSVVILLGILIFVHELGHFLVAKWSGVGVLKFSLGFGPRLIGKRIGETEYLISAVPLGGYVKLLGEGGEEDLTPEDEKRSFQNQSVYKRIAIVAAGPLFNFLLAIIAFSIIYTIGVPTLTSRVGEVQEGSAAFDAGIKEGDMILSVGGKDVSSWSDMAARIRDSGGRDLNITIERNNKLYDLAVRPEAVEGKNIFGEAITSYKIGIASSSETITVRLNPLMAVVEGAEQAWWFTKLTYVSIVKIIQRVISPSTLGGPIMIAKMSGEYAKQGIIPFIFFMSVLSINLGVLNLLPIPVLDGGHLMFYIIEIVTGKELNMKWREMAQQVGFFLLIMLMVFVFYNDIVRIVNG
ncbi:MAG: RIP metalloprotease RseP [Deltaproteobacteria bacterium]|nr:RIP metalloprotease RseP [Deltaproteobacteria bacterium]